MSEKTSLSRKDAERIVRLLLNRQPAFKLFGIIIRTPMCQYKIQLPQQKHPNKRMWIVMDQSVIDTGISARMVRAMPDLVSAILGTAACVTLGVASAAEVAVAPASGGATMALAALTWAGAAASAATTGVSIGRVYNEVFGNPENNELMDSHEWVGNTMLVLDVIAIGSLSAARTPLLFSLLKNRKTQGQMLSTMNELSTMNRASRKKLTQEIGRVLVNNKATEILSRSHIDKLLRKEILEVTSSALGIVSSFYSGALGSGSKMVIRSAIAAVG